MVIRLKMHFKISFKNGGHFAQASLCLMSMDWHNAKKKQYHDDVIKWKHFPRRWPFVRGIHRSPVNSPHKGQWRGALRFSSICAWINNWVNNREAGDLRRHRAHNDVIVMGCFFWVHSLDKVLAFFLLYCVQYHVIYDPWYIERQ